MKKPLAPTLNDVLGAASDEYCIKLLEAFATDRERSLVPETMQMSRKVFYTRIAELRKNGLVTGRGGKYSLTAFGRIVYNAQKTIAKGLDSRWKLTAIDTIMSTKQLSAEEYAKVIDRLLEDIDLKDIILSEIADNFGKARIKFKE